MADPASSPTSQKFWEGFTWLQLFYLIIAAIAAFGSVWSVTHDTQPNKAETEKAFWEFMNSKKNQATSSGSSPPVTEPAKVRVQGESFSCSTQEEKDSGIRDAVRQILKDGTSMTFGSGCAKVDLNATVTKFSARDYQLVFPDSRKPGWSFVCGDTNGNSDSLDSCLQMARGRSEVLLIVQNGGYATFN